MTDKPLDLATVHPRLAAAAALTLLNPWGHAIAHLGKRIENRSWTVRRGTDVVLIHAGRGWDDDAWPFLAELGFRFGRENVTTGAIVALATVTGVCRATVTDPEADCDCGDWAAAGQYHWRLADYVRVLSEPVPCRGALGLWTPAPDVLAAVARQVAA